MSGRGSPAGFAGLPPRRPDRPAPAPGARTLTPARAEGCLKAGARRRRGSGGREPEEPPRRKVPDAHATHTHGDSRCRGNQVNHQALVGEVGTPVSGQGTRPGENQRWGKGSCPGPPRASFPGRLPSKGAPRRRDWWSRRRNTSRTSRKTPWRGGSPGRGLGGCARRRRRGGWGRFLGAGRPDLAQGGGTLCGRSAGPRAPPSYPGRKPRGDLPRARARRNPEVRGRAPACGRAGGVPRSRATMAREPGPGAASAGSHTLLDAVLQTLYDFGECGASAATCTAGLGSRGRPVLRFRAKSPCRTSPPLGSSALVPGWIAHTLGRLSLPPTGGLCRLIYSS